MATFQQTLSFRLYEDTWQEVYYGSAGSAEAAANWSELAISAALSFRATATVLRTIEARLFPSDRLGYLRQVQQSAPGGPADRPNPDVTAVAARYRYSGEDGARRFVWFRGLPDDWVTRDLLTGRPLPSVNLTNAVNNYVTFVKAGPQSVAPSPLQIRRYKRLTELGANGYGRVTAIAVNATNDGLTDVTIAADISTWTSLRFIGTTNARLLGMRGEFKIEARNGNIATIAYRLREAPPVVPPPKLKAVKVDFSFSNIIGHLFQNFSTHDTSSPFARHRGRTSAVSRRQ